MPVIEVVSSGYAGSNGQGSISVERAHSFSRPYLHKNLIIEFVLCMILLPPTFYVAHPKIGGYAFVLLLAVFLAYHTLRREPLAMLCLIVGASPMIALLRGTFMPFDTPVVLLGFSLGWAYLVSPTLFRDLWKRKDILYLMGACVVYWAFSYVRTQDYANNLRALELGLCAAMVFLLNSRRSYLATALVGTGICVITEGLMLAPYGDRLGMGYVPGMDWEIGNPILIGIPAALFVVLTLAEGGRWLLLENHPRWRVILGAGSAACLIFSTSRGSWILAIMGMAMLAIYDPQSRKAIGTSVAVGALALVALANTAALGSVIHYFNNATSADSTIEKRTTGRIDQWRAIPAILKDSPFIGVGPGSGRAASRSYANKGIIFHSLYLQVAAEMGFLGIGLLSILLFDVIQKDVMHFKKYREIVPLLGTIGFMMMGLSVSAIDLSGGLLLGIGLIGGCASNLWMIRGHALGTISALPPEVEADEESFAAISPEVISRRTESFR